MRVTWKTIDTYLSSKSTPNDELYALRQIYNIDVFQDYLLLEFGILTERNFKPQHVSHEVSLGTLDDLGSLDTYDLIDFIESHSISYGQAKTITPNQMALIGDEAGSKIRALLAGSSETGRGDDETRYILSSIVQTGFPYRAVKGDQHFERKNGDLTVTMTTPNKIGLPYGMYPRWLFVYICSEVVKTKKNRIDMGASLKKFVEDELGGSWSKGKTGTGIRWRQQLISLLSTNFSILWESNDGGEGGNRRRMTLKNARICSHVELWWDDENKNKDDDFAAHIIVDDDFASGLREHASPLDMRALRKLSGAPFDFDVYCWLTYRYSRMISEKRNILRLSWDSLKQQYGTAVKERKDFIKRFRVALEKVKAVYPDAVFDATDDKVLLLFSTPSHIASARKPLN